LPTTSLTRTGYSFNGWNVTAGGSATNVQSTATYASFVTDGDTSPLTLTAQWQAKGYTLALDANGGSVSPEFMQVTYGQKIGTLPVPTRDKHHFEGWYTKATDGSPVGADTFYTTDANSTLYAHGTRVFAPSGLFLTSALNGASESLSFETDSAGTDWTYTASTHTLTITDNASLSGTFANATSQLNVTISSGTTLSSYADISALEGYVGSLLYLNGPGTLSVASGTISATEGTAITLTDEAGLIVAGGTIKASGLYGRALHLSKGASVNILSGSIQTLGTQSIPVLSFNQPLDTAVHIFMSGGHLLSSSVQAIDINGPGSATLTGGVRLSFASATTGTVAATVTIAPLSLSASGNTALIAWDAKKGTRAYVQVQDIDLFFGPKTSAIWSVQQGVSGISYTCGDNTGFIPLPVVVNTQTANTSQFVRHAGTDRYETAVLASMHASPDAAKADTVIIATGTNFPDALAAATLAGTTSAPILLTSPETLSDAVHTELERLVPSTVCILGDTNAVSQKTESAIRSLSFVPSVIRIGGAERYQTASAIAKEAINKGALSTELYLAKGSDFPDALSVSAFAAYRKVPLLLTDEAPFALNLEVISYLNTYHPKRIYILDSEASISQGVITELLDLHISSANIIRLGGENRNETAAAILTTLLSAYQMTPQLFGVATNTNFPDALVGGASLGLRKGMLLPASVDALSPIAYQMLAEYAYLKPAVEIFGSDASVSVGVEQEIGRVLG
jgi:uncharacterized repeat protein (TIGR02543 family)